MSSVKLDGTSNPFISEPYVSQRDSGQGPSIGPLPANRYGVERLIGRGSYSSVFLAYDTVRQENVALKIAEAPGCDPETARAVLEHENRMYRRVSGHPHVLMVYDLHYVCCEGNDLLLLSMELGEASLREWLDQHRNDYQTRLAQGLEYFKQMLYGVHAIHKASIVHLDLKPENFILVRGVVKVSDLGASRHIQNIRLASSTQSLAPRHWTPPYVSPERLANPRNVDKRADVYSLGAIAYEMFSRECRPPVNGGRAPFHGSSSSSDTSFLEELPKRIARVIRRCLEDV